MYVISTKISFVNDEMWSFHKTLKMAWRLPGPGCSKLTTSLVNVSLKFQTLISTKANIFIEKNVRSFCNVKASLIFSTKISV